MNEVFDNDLYDEDEQQQLAPRRDTELTLGPMTLFGLSMALLLLCIICFGLGYKMGSHGTQTDSTNGQQAATQTPMQDAETIAKPSAAPQSLVPQHSDAESQSTTDDTDAAPVTAEQSSISTPAISSNPMQPLVRPALSAEETTPQPATASALMVQIATVSQKEDADVLVGALRKRGYAVAARHDLSDGLIHVQVGPFNNRSDANAVRQRLLNDGYNAVVE